MFSINEKINNELEYLLLIDIRNLLETFSIFHLNLIIDISNFLNELLSKYVKKYNIENYFEIDKRFFLLQSNKKEKLEKIVQELEKYKKKSILSFNGYNVYLTFNYLLIITKLFDKNKIFNTYFDNIFNLEKYNFLSFHDFLEYQEILFDLINKQKENNILIFKQNIIDIRKNEICKSELLTRIYNKKKNKYYNTFYLLELSKQLGLYNKISRKILEKIFSKKHEFPVSINLAIYDIIDKDNYLYIKDYIINKDKDIDITFEITEQDKFHNRTLKLLQELRKCMEINNVKIAIDDFGSGYSNIHLLSLLKPDFVKLDGHLLDFLELQEHQELLKFFVKFTNENNIKLVAEFVDSDKKIKILNEIGIYLFQGYYFHKPEFYF